MTRVSIALVANGLPFSQGGSSGRSAGGCVGGTTVDCDPVGASTNSSVDSRDTAFSVGGGCADVDACAASSSCERTSSPAASSLAATAGTPVAAAGTSVATALTDVDA